MPLVAPDMPVLDVYYASTCAPCRAELGVLAEVVREGSPKLVIYLLTDETEARAELAAASPHLPASAVALPPGRTEREVLRLAGDADGILPFARMRAADGRLCGMWRGILTGERIRALLKACG
jgi:thiol-disulfide isomerase/thioredoxin